MYPLFFNFIEIFMSDCPPVGTGPGEPHGDIKFQIAARKPPGSKNADFAAPELIKFICSLHAGPTTT